MSYAPLTSARALIVDAHSSAHLCSKALECSVRGHRQSMRQSVIGDARNLARHCYDPGGVMYTSREKHADPHQLIDSSYDFIRATNRFYNLRISFVLEQHNNFIFCRE